MPAAHQRHKWSLLAPSSSLLFEISIHEKPVLYFCCRWESKYFLCVASNMSALLSYHHGANQIAEISTISTVQAAGYLLTPLMLSSPSDPLYATLIPSALWVAWWIATKLISAENKHKTKNDKTIMLAKVDTEKLGLIPGSPTSWIAEAALRYWGKFQRVRWGHHVKLICWPCWKTRKKWVLWSKLHYLPKWIS